MYGNSIMKQSFTDLREQEKKNRQDLILDAAERAFSARPFTLVSMREIAREAGISHTAIYRHFPDQQTLFVEAFLRGIHKLTPLLETALIEEDGLEKASELFIDFLVVHDHYYRMMANFMLDPRLTTEQIERLNDVERTLLDLFDLYFRKIDPDADVRIHSHSFFASLNGILITFRDYPGRDRKEVLLHMKKLGRHVAGVYRRGITSPDIQT